MRWEWNQLLHSLGDPAWAIGLAVQARRAGEAAMPLGQRLAVALGPMLVTGIIAAAGSLMGGYIAVEKRFAGLEKSTDELKLLLNSRIDQRNSEITGLRQADMDHASRIAAVETLQRVCGENLAELRAMVRHELDETARRRAP